MRLFVFSAAVAALSIPAFVQSSAADTKDNVNVDEIVKKFAAKEAEFAEARNNYTYRQSAKIQLLDAGGNPTNQKWEEVADIIFTPEGKRIEKVVYAPVSTLERIQMTSEDLADLRNVQPFVLTTKEIPEYNIN